MAENLWESATSAKIGSVFIGGRIALNFANLDLPPPTRDGSMEDFTRFVDFLEVSGIIPTGATSALFDLWTNAPQEAAEFLGSAGALCGALGDAFKARASGGEIQVEWVETINEILAYTEGHDRLEPIDGGEEGPTEWRLALHARAHGLEWLLTAIARNAAELIAEGPLAPIRKCANPDCGFLFYDDSRTGKRRWCSMAVCGNRAKVAAHYRREKSKQ